MRVFFSYDMNWIVFVHESYPTFLFWPQKCDFMRVVIAFLPFAFMFLQLIKNQIALLALEVPPNFYCTKEEATKINVYLVSKKGLLQSKGLFLTFTLMPFGVADERGLFSCLFSLCKLYFFGPHFRQLRPGGNKWQKFYRARNVITFFLAVSCSYDSRNNIVVKKEAIFCAFCIHKLKVNVWPVHWFYQKKSYETHFVSLCRFTPLGVRQLSFCLSSILISQLCWIGLWTGKNVKRIKKTNKSQNIIFSGATLLAPGWQTGASWLWPQFSQQGKHKKNSRFFHINVNIMFQVSITFQRQLEKPIQLRLIFLTP